VFDPRVIQAPLLTSDNNTNIAQQYDRTDRMLHPTYFIMIERMIGKKFTLDACANPNGDNALCDNYCSMNNSFLNYNCAGETVWLNPRFRHTTMKLMIIHYLNCKQQAPYTTSACTLLPEWTVSSFANLLRGMKTLTTITKGTPAMTVPTFPQPNLPGRSIFPSGLPFKILLIYHDPPLQPPSPDPNDDISPDDLNPQGFMAPCQIAEQISTTAHFGPSPATKAIMAIDTLASRNFVDYNLIKNLKVKIKRHPPWLTNIITLGDNSQRQSLGVVHLQIKLGDFYDMIWCEVLDLPDEFQLILGQAWLNKHKCILNFRDKSCILYAKGRRHIIDCGPHTLPSTQPAVDFNKQSPGTETPTIITALQAKRLLRKSKALDINKSYLIMVSHSKPTTEDLEDNQPEDLKTILRRHPKALGEPPQALPPERDINHSISLVPGSSPPFKPVYRLSTKERKEVKDTIKDLLEKGHINIIIVWSY
jgi:hypothetical protein